VLSAVINRNIERNRARIPEQSSHEIHFAIGTGTRGGRPTIARCDVVIEPDPMYAAYVDAGTSMNASIAAQLLLGGAAKAGVWAPEEIFAVPAYFAEMEKRRFTVTLGVSEE
jgi:hypothetical protein